MRVLRKALAISLALFAGVYLVVCGLLYFNQRSMMYFPTPPVGAPQIGIEVVKLKTADGETLIAWWLPPADSFKPVFLLFNGNNDSLAFQGERLRAIAAQGAGLLAVAYRGYDGSTGAPTEKGLREDAAAAYEFLLTKAAPDRIVIHGFSLGSGVATWLASQKPARALVLEAPYTAAVDLAAELYPWAPVRLLMRDRYLSRELIGTVGEPVLIVHGDRDAVVPYHHGPKLFSKAVQPKTFVRMVGSEHSTLTRDGLYDHVWRFLGVPFDGTTAAGGRPARFEIIGG